MASKEDLSEQLALTQKVAAQIERMAAAADKLQQSYEGQITAVQKLADAFNQINTQNTVQNIEALNKAVGDASKKMSSAGTTSESTFSKLGKKVEDTGKKIGDKFPKSVAVGVAALTGFEQGVSNVVALGKGLTGFVSGFVDGLANITASIIAIPFKLFEGLIDLAAKGGGGSNELAKAIEELRKQFGELYGPTNKAIIDTSKSLKGFSDTGLSAWRVFGNLADRFNMLRELATEMGAQFNKFHKEFEDNGGALLAYQKGLGLNNEQMKGLAVVATSTGQKMGNVLKDFTKFSKALADSDDDAKLLSRDMGKMAGDVKHFGQLGAKELGEVAIYARKLGVEVDKMTGTLDAFESFDTAAENAAKLSQAFGANVDAFKLMEAQNPAEQFDMLRKSMFAAGKSAENMTRQELKLLSQTTGMDEQTAKLAFSMKNQGMGLDEIKKKSGDAEKKTLTQAQAMGKLADAIERMVQSGGGGMQGGFWDMFVKGFLGGIQASKEFREIMMNIRRALMLTYMEGVKLGKAFVAMFPGVKEFFKGIGDLFDPKKFKDFVGGTVTILEDWMKSLTASSGPMSFSSLMDRLQENFFNFFNKETPAGKKMIEGFKTTLLTLANVFGEGLKWASDRVGEGLGFIIDMIKDPSKLLKMGAGAAEGGMGFLGKVIMPMVDGLSHAWTVIAPKLLELVKLLGGKLYDYLTSKDFLNLVKPALPVLAAVLFGPAVTRSIFAMGVTAIGGGIKSAIAGGVKEAAGAAEGIASKAASGGGSGGLLTRIMGPVLGNPYVAIAAATVALGVVGTGFSKGVEKFQDQISKDIGDAADRKMGASIAGLVQMLSFGMIGDQAAKGMATSFAEYSDQFNKTIENIFGEDVAKNVKKVVEKTFDQLIDIGDIFRNLFSGDIGGAIKSLGKLLLDVAEGAMQQMQLIFLTLPVRLISWLGDSVAALASWLDKLFQSGSQPSVLDSLVDGIKSIGKVILPLIVEIPKQLLLLLGNHLIPAVLSIAGALTGLVYRIPGALFEAISGQLKSWFGKDNWASKWIFDPIYKTFMDIGNAIPFFAKYIGNAISSLTDYLKAKASGKDSKVDIFPNIGKSYEDYKDNLKKTAVAAVSDNAEAQKQISQSAPKQDKTDASSFIQHASATVGDLKKLKDNLGAVTEKELGSVREAFSRILNMFGDDKTLQDSVGKIKEISMAFDSLGTISAAAAIFKEKFSKVSSIDVELMSFMNVAKAVGSMLNDPGVSISPSAISGIAATGKAFEAVAQLSDAYKSMTEDVIKATASIKGDGVVPALNAVQKMIGIANDLNSALSDGNLNKIDVKAKLQNVAKAVGLGGKATYTVNPSRAVQITVNMTVEINAADMEKALVMRGNSVIRDRINFALSDPTTKAGPEIPSSPQDLPNVTKR